MTRGTNRRDVLRAGAAVALGTLAGCLAFGGGGGRPDWDVAALDTGDGSERWTVSAIPASGLTYADGTVFVGGESGLVALAAEDGSEQWTFESENHGDASRPDVVGEDVYYANEDSVRSFGGDDGTEHWSFEAEEDVSSGAARVGDVVVFGTTDGRIYGVDAADGTERWRLDAGEEVGGGPGVGDDVAVFATTGGRVSAVNAADGSERWRASVPMGISTGLSPMVTAGEAAVYVSSLDESVYAMELDGGATRWEFQADATTHLTVRDGYGYGGHDEGYDGDDMGSSRGGAAISIDLETGEHHWSEKEDFWTVVAPPAVGDAAAYFPAEEGVAALDTDYGPERWRKETGTEMRVTRHTADGAVFAAVGEDFFP